MATLQPINLTASTSLDSRHAGTILTASAAAGMTLTLPAATGSGRSFTILVAVTVTSNNLIVQVTGNDTMAGVAQFAKDSADTVDVFETASDSDTITMNGSTKGGIKGDKIILIDVAADLWSVVIQGSATGTEATPFSAAVS